LTLFAGRVAVREDTAADEDCLRWDISAVGDGGGEGVLAPLNGEVIDTGDLVYGTFEADSLFLEVGEILVLTIGGDPERERGGDTSPP
jgi:hypothetical protein